jgi:TPP-dependent pyruvate/acetoin dehydrogenase alpha subunit
MDPVVVLRATRHAVAQARGGGGAAFLEFSTYRFDVHHRSSSGPAYDPGTWRR